jgi:hypothetical protein
MPGFWNREHLSTKALEAKSEVSFSGRAVGALCKALEVEPPTRDVRGEGFVWFRENYPDFPVFMESRKTEIDLLHMFTKPTTTDTWSTFLDVVEEYQRPYVGLMVQAVGMGFVVFHNAWHIPAVAGYTRMERRIAGRTEGVILEPVAGFAACVKAVWTP